MYWQQKIGGIFAIALLGSAQAAGAQAETPRVSGVLENYVMVYPQPQQMQTQAYLTYLHLQGHIRPGLRFVAGTLFYRGHNVLDENYLELGKDKFHWQVGRFRSAFGHSDWSDLYYSGFVRFPLIRMTTLGKNFRLTRFDTGLSVRGEEKAVEYQIGWIDPFPRTYALLPNHPDHLIGRVQTYRGNLIVGLNALLKPDQLDAAGTRLFDLDFRWSVPQVQARGEFLTGQAQGRHAEGYYIDLFYHPVKLYRTTFLARLEGMSATGGDTGWSQLYTAGVKQIVSPLLTLELTRVWGNGIAPAEYARGWAIQAITFIHF
ncbi:MAG TPA: hypothetical protein VFA07_10715 [Chthonomonadaceae bacterium]|nr:hypothetical protein [Chthonomonadaceae bacterium]